MKHPKLMGEEDVAKFLTYLANERQVAASTQNQALNAIVFLYKHVLKKSLGDFSSYARAKRSRFLPVVLTENEVRQIFEHLQGTPKLIVGLIRLRVKAERST